MIKDSDIQERKEAIAKEVVEAQAVMGVILGEEAAHVFNLGEHDAIKGILMAQALRELADETCASIIGVVGETQFERLYRELEKHTDTIKEVHQQEITKGEK